MGDNIIRRLSEIFCDHLIDDIGPDNMVLLVSRQKREEDPNICHTHDFCDANMTMDTAFKRMLNRDMNLQSSMDMDLINSAWDLAKQNNYYWESGL